MKYNIYSLRDNSAGYFGLPIYARNDEEMVRQLKFEIQKSKSLVSDFPSDFDLYCIGTFDDASATVSQLDNRLVVHMSAILKGDKDA